MGGVVEGGVGTANKTSPCLAAIQKVQTELRQEYDVREKKKRELEFLEKGGNPLDFKLGNTAFVSVQSTSYTDQHLAQVAASEAKGSFELTTSTHDDSVESSGRPDASSREPNFADNLSLFDAEYEFSEGDRNSLHPSRNNTVPSKQSYQMDVGYKALEFGDSAAFGIPRKSYKRRYRSRPNRDVSKPSSTDLNSTYGSHDSSLPSSPGPRDVKRLKAVADAHQDMKLDGVKAVGSTRNLNDGASVDTASDTIASGNLMDEPLNQQSLSGASNTHFELDTDGPAAIQTMDEMGSVGIQCQLGFTASKAEKRAKFCQMNGFSNSIDGNDNKMCTKMGIAGNTTNQTFVPDNSRVIEGGDFIKDNKGTDDNASTLVSESMSTGHCLVQNGSELHPDKEIDISRSSLNTGVKDNNTIEGMQDHAPSGSESNRVHTDLLGQHRTPQNETCCDVRHQGSTDTRILDFSEAGSLTGVSAVFIEAHTSKLEPKMTNVVDEDSILKEAQIIKAKWKRIMELSMMTSHTEIRQKSQWDYVLEEMAWLANDFAQERIWRISAASQICHQVAFTCRLRKQEQFSGMTLKKVAHTLAKAVMEFWHSVEEKSREAEQQNENDGTVPVRAYAVRFLKYNNSNAYHDQAEMPLTPDRISDLGILDLSWDDSLTEEDIFYSIPPGAMETYRKSIESHVAMYEGIGGSVREKVETSPNDAMADFGCQDNTYFEDEGETSTYDMSLAVESSKSFRIDQMNRKDLKHAFGQRSYEKGSNLLPIQSAEHKLVTQQPSLLVKRPGSSINVSVPTRRVRTSSRRVISPFSAGESGCIQFPNKTDASSGDTDSIQNDQTALRGGPLVPNTCDTESVGNLENQLQFDSAEVSMKPKRKKKVKHLRWQANSGFQHDQRDQFKKRTDNHQLESNGSSGLIGPPVIKKPKIMRPSHDNSYNNLTPTSRSVPSPVASQMSNMSNPIKFIKMLGGRDRGRKPKAHKVPAGQPGSGSAWSKFEEQALVVLVHDLGPNWVLISDAFNSCFHFKCAFRRAEECKERHKLLVDRTSGDGADSAEDSGSSQPYPSTLPGIPKGSARQLFLRLQEPIEEETLKFHFEKIIMISQKKHCRKAQDPKQLQQPHSSHTMALSQVFPNNLNGGPILTPLDLCVSTMAVPDVLPLGFQGPHSSGLAVPSQTAVDTILPHSSANPALQGTQNMPLGNNLSSSPGPLSSPISRDAKYVVPRSASFSADEQQRMQQYKSIVSNRNVPQSNISAPGGVPGVDRGVHILLGNNGMNKSLPIARPGLQGFASPSMLNSGSMVSPVMTPSPMHTGVVSGQGSSMPRPREASHMMRDSPRKMVGSDLQMPGNNQCVSHFGGLSSSTPNHIASPSYTIHHQPARPVSAQQPHVLGPRHPHFQGPGNNAPTPQQQAYAMRLAKERQLQNRFLPSQQLASSNSLMQSHIQTLPQVPVSSPLQNNSQIHMQTSSEVSLSPSTPSSSMALNPKPQQKHPTPTQSVKQRQKQQQQLSQSCRQHPQQGKLSKGVGKGNLTMNQNIPIDPSPLNGVSVNPVNQSLDRGEPENLMLGQGLYTGSVKRDVQPKKCSLNSAPASSSLKRPHEIKSRSDNSTQGHNIPSVVPPGVPADHQSIPSVATAGSSHQQALSHRKLTNQNQSPTQRGVTPNHQMNYDPSHKPRATESNADQHPTSSSAKMDSEPTFSQASTNATNAVRVVSPVKTHQLQPPDPLLDSNALNSAANPSVSSPLSSSGSVPQVAQGPILHSHQQAQLLRVGNGDLYGRPSDPGPE